MLAAQKSQRLNIMTPQICGFPLWFGKVKKRLAKKYCNQNTHMSRIMRERGASLAHLKPGDLINTCSGFNEEIIKIKPSWINVSSGFVLFDLDFQLADEDSCSLAWCDVRPALARDVLEQRYLDIQSKWVQNGKAAAWYADLAESGLDPASIKTLHQMLQILKEGGHITDDLGRLLSEFKTNVIPPIATPFLMGDG